MLGVLVVSSCGSERLRCGGFCWDKCVCVGLDEVDLCVCVCLCVWEEGEGGPTEELWWRERGG